MPLIRGHVIYGRERFDIRISRSSIDIRALSPEEMECVEGCIGWTERYLEKIVRGPTKENVIVNNAIIYRNDWLSPTITGPVVELDDPRGQYQYYLAILNALKDVKQRGYVTRHDDSILSSFNAPNDLLLDPNAERHTIIA